MFRLVIIYGGRRRLYNTMKRLFAIFLYLACSTITLADGFCISKVNRVEKQWVIPPDRRNFIGNRGIQKFDYGRQILKSEDRGEIYVVTWGYSGQQLTNPLILRFEYRLALNQKEPYAEEYSYPNLKSGTYKWTLKNLGERYIKDGKVDRWKVSLILDEKPVAEKRSATWYAMEGT